MKRSRQIIVLILSFVMALSVLFACNNADGTEDAPGATTSSNIISVDGSSDQESTSSKDGSSSQGGIVDQSDTSNDDSSSIDPIEPETLPTATRIVSDVSSVNEDDVFAVKLLENVDFHTALQKQYLNDTLESISKYASGDQELSYPEAVKLEWNFKPSDDSLEFLNYEIKLSENEDLGEAKTYTVTTPDLSIYNLKIGTDYFYTVTANFGTETFESEVVSFNTSDQGPRNLFIEGISNSRDIGGRATEDGGMVRQGLLYRTARLNDSNTNTVQIQITENGIAAMRELGMKTELDLRGYTDNEPGGITSSPLGDDVNYYLLPMQWSGVANLLLGNNESIVRTFEILANKNNYPVFYHCNIGTDRTGMITMLVGGLLGIPEEELYRDYLFSNFGNIGGSRSLGDQSSVNSVYGYMNQLRAFKGNSFAEKVYNYLLTIGVPARNLNRTISILKEGGAKITGSSTFIDTTEMIANNQLSATKPTYDFAPSEYYVLNDGKSSVFVGVNASEATSASVYAYVSNSNTSATVNSTVKMMVDGVEQSIATTTYNTEGCRSDAQRYWVAIKLCDVNLSAGDHTISLTSLSGSGPNVAGIAVIPAKGTVTSKKEAIDIFEPEESGDKPFEYSTITVGGKTYTSRPTDYYQNEDLLTWYYEEESEHSIYQIKGSDASNINANINEAGDVYLNSGGTYLTFNIWMKQATTADIVLLATVSDSSSTHEVSGSMQISVNNGSRTASTATGTYASYGATSTTYGTIPYATVSLNQGLNSIQIYRNGNYGCRVGYVRVIPSANIDRGDLAKEEHGEIVDGGMLVNGRKMRFEAENAQFEGTASGSSGQFVGNSDMASGGKRVGGLARSGNAVVFTFNAPSDGTVDIVLAASSTTRGSGNVYMADMTVSSANLGISVNGNALTYSGTAIGWEDSSYAYNGPFTEIAVDTVSVDEGENVIRVYYVTGSVPNIDYIDLTFHKEVSSVDPENQHTHEYVVTDTEAKNNETPLTFYSCEDDGISYYEIDHVDITDKLEGTRDGGIYLSVAGNYLKVYVWVDKATTADVSIEFLVSSSSSTFAPSSSLQLSVNGGARVAVTADGSYASYGATAEQYGRATLGTVRLNAGLNAIEIYRNGNYGCTVGKVIVAPKDAIDRTATISDEPDIPDDHEHEFEIVATEAKAGETPITMYSCEDDGISYYEIDHVDITDKLEGTRDGGIYLSVAGNYLKVYVWVDKATTADVSIEFLVSSSSSTFAPSSSLQLSVNGGARVAVTADGSYASYGATAEQYGRATLGTVQLNAGLNAIEIYRNGNYGCTVGKVIVAPKAAVDRTASID